MLDSNIVIEHVANLEPRTCNIVIEHVACVSEIVKQAD